jgi:DNA-binding NarL/FixJ family response regulator
MDLSTVLIADAHGLLRRQRSSVLAEQNDLPVVGAATHGRQLRNRGEALQPHVLLLKLRLPEIDWLAMLLKIRAKNPSAESGDLFWHDQMLLTLTTRVGIDPCFQFIRTE